MSAAARNPVVTLLSDFGDRDGFVGVVKGVILKHCPQAQLVDLSHAISPQDVLGGALVLAEAVRHFPPRTVHLAIVDPGVGSARRPLLIETADFVLVGPDNGLLSLAAAAAKVERILHLDRPEYFQPSPSRTFHGRDVFAPLAARVAAGESLEALGTGVEAFERVVLPALRRLDDALEGQVIHIDRFGNLVCNIGASDLGSFPGGKASVSICGVQLPTIGSHYSEVREGKPVALWNSWGRLEIAVRNGSAARQLRARQGDRVQVRIQGSRG